MIPAELLKAAETAGVTVTPAERLEDYYRVMHGNQFLGMVQRRPRATAWKWYGYRNKGGSGPFRLPRSALFYVAEASKEVTITVKMTLRDWNRLTTDQKRVLARQAAIGAYAAAVLLKLGVTGGYGECQDEVEDVTYRPSNRTPPLDAGAP